MDILLLLILYLLCVGYSKFRAKLHYRCINNTFNEYQVP